MRNVIILLTCWASLSICHAEPQPTNRFQIWLKGYHYRLSLQGKPVPMKFTAVDGRKVDLSQMNGKVVLVDFWETECVPCVAAMPRIKAALKTYGDKGFEVIGISSDTDKDKLEKLVKDKDIPWPQYFEGQQRNQFVNEFGINQFPHLFLVDKKGCLRFDNVDASGAKEDFEGKIESLLAEK